MRKMTRLLVAILISVVLALTGCGGGGGSDDIAIVDTGDTGGDTGGTGGDTGGTGGDTGGTGGDTGGTGGDTGGTGGDTGGTGGDTGGTGGGTGGTGGGTGGGDDQPTVAETDFNLVELAGLGGNFSAGVAINIDGLAVGLSDDGSSVKGAKWLVTDGSPTAIELSPLPGNNYSAAYGVNDPGVAVGESGAIVGEEPDANADANTVAVYWPIGATLPSTLSTVGLFDGGASAAFAINQNGEIVGEAVNDDSGNTVAVYWPSSSADPVVLGNLSAGSFSSAYFISSVGDIVGEAQNAQGQAQAVVWSPSAGGGYEAPTSMNPVANQIRSAAFGIDFNGSIVGEAELASGEVQGIIWNINGSVDSSLGEDTSAQAINDVDRVVGYTEALSDNDSAAIWNVASIADFRNLAGIFSQAYALNDNNQIVGMAGNQAFAAIPVSQ